MKKSLLVSAGCLFALALTACAGPAAPHSGSDHPKAPGKSLPSFTKSAALGESSTSAPYPNCALATANWTGANGPLWVTVMADGVETLSATVTQISGSTSSKLFTIPGGGDAHIFVFKSIPPSDVAKVLVTAKGNDIATGGSCWATGGPDA